MDTTVAAALTTGLGDWKDAALGQFGSLIPVALGVVITIAVAFFIIRAFRAMAHV